MDGRWEADKSLVAFSRGGLLMAPVPHLPVRVVTQGVAVSSVVLPSECWVWHLQPFHSSECKGKWREKEDVEEDG